MVVTLYEVLNNQPIFIPAEHIFYPDTLIFEVANSESFIKVNRLSKIADENYQLLIEAYFRTLHWHLNLTPTSKEAVMLEHWRRTMLDKLNDGAVVLYCSSAEFKVGNYETIYVQSKDTFFIPAFTFHR